MKKDKENKFLTLSGLQTLLKALNEKFSKKEHKHSRSDITDLVIASKEKAGIVRPSGNYLTVSPTGDLNVTIPTAANNIAGIVKIGDNINLTNDVISVPVASDSVAGVIMIGDGLIVNENGTLSVDKENNTTYKLYEDFSWRNLHSFLRDMINDMSSENLYGTYVELRNINKNNLSHKRFTIQITKDVVDVMNESERFFNEINRQLLLYSDGELEILYPQSEFDKHYIIDEFPYYLLIRLLSKENMDFACLHYINTLLSKTEGMEDIKAKTSRNITKRVEITECSQNIEERMELLFERPGENSDSENYSFDEYFYNGKQIMPIVFELIHTKDTNRNIYRYEIVQ